MSLALEEANTKVAYLDFLKLHGLTGLHEFLYAFISSLAKRDQRIAKAAGAK